MRLFARIMRLLTMVAFVIALVPAGPAAAQQGATGNLIENADFEGDVHGVGCCSNVANGWTDFHRIRVEGKDQNFQNHEPQYGNNRGDRRRNGNGSMTWGKDYATHDAGIFQRVKLPYPNGKVTFAAWMVSWSGNGNNWGDNPQAAVGKMIGIDPTGNTDVWASTVVWSAENWGALDWQRLSISTVAKGDAATVFIRSRNELPMQRNAVFVDEVSLIEEPSTPPLPPGPPVAVNDQLQDDRYFFQTGFRVSDDAFWNYFSRRGGVRTFGYPVSRTFRLLGSDVQVFQRRVLQKTANGQVSMLNLLDNDFMPYNSFNQAQIPPQDSAVLGTAPPPGSVNYGRSILDYVRRVAPDQWNGMQVNFQNAFRTSVTAAEVFGAAAPNLDVLPGIQIELWGVPTSNPIADPKNANFVYQRWQRGVMHFDRTTGSTQGLLLADYFKSILTGWNLPADVADSAKSSRFINQYNPASPNSIARPDALPDSNLTNAFQSGPTR